MKNDGVDGRQYATGESPDAFTPSGQPKNLNMKGGANTGTDLDSSGGAQRVDGRPGGAPNSREAVGQMGGLHDPRKISSLVVDAQSVTLPDVPITADPANEGG